MLLKKSWEQEFKRMVNQKSVSWYPENNFALMCRVDGLK
jgi:hypothetical protein